MGSKVKLKDKPKAHPVICVSDAYLRGGDGS